MTADKWTYISLFKYCTNDHELYFILYYQRDYFLNNQTSPEREQAPGLTRTKANSFLLSPFISGNPVLPTACHHQAAETNRS